MERMGPRWGRVATASLVSPWVPPVPCWEGRSMAFLEKRGSTHRVLFRYGGKRYTFTVGPNLAQAEAVCGRVQGTLYRLKNKFTALPAGADIVTFVVNGGSIPEE